MLFNTHICENNEQILNEAYQLNEVKRFWSHDRFTVHDDGSDYYWRFFRRSWMFFQAADYIYFMSESKSTSPLHW